MPVIFLEEVLKKSKTSNKYVAVNIAAQRARNLTERSIAMLTGNAPKPVTIALEELVAGRIGHRVLDQAQDTADDSPFGAIDDEDVTVAEELQPPSTFVDDSKPRDLDDQEEGL